MSYPLLNDLLNATLETIYMVSLSTFLSLIFGAPLGTLLFVSERIRPHPLTARILNGLVNLSRSIPFIILIVALIPLTRLLVGTAIGTNAAIVPLTLGAIPLVARLVENVLSNLPLGLLETGLSIGASPMQMIRKIYFPEALPALIQTLTVTAITLVNYSAMAGVVGGGGLGDLAIRYGYQRFDLTIMIITIVLLIILVQVLQTAGDYLAKKFSH